jgi:hypothetical protein
MSGASEAVVALQGAAREAYRATHLAGSHFHRQHADVQATTELMAVMARFVDLIGAVEELHRAADLAVASLRKTLAAQMDATGCPQVYGAVSAAHMARKPAVVSIDEVMLVPKQYLREVPDKKLILEALKIGQEVPGATLIRPNELSLVLRSRKEPTP